MPDELKCWEEPSCEDQILAEWNWWNDFLYEQAKFERRNEFLNQYLSACMAGAKKIEQFDMTFKDREYHYTLYYYDVAGNLVRTVPPAGVQPIRDNADLAAVGNHRDDPTTYPTAVYPLHSPAHSSPQDELVTYYEYNTFGQVQKQATPDGGTTDFWYDVLGRVRYSQNAKQANYTYDTYSATDYDALGRVTGVYEATLNAALGNVYTNTATYDFINGTASTGYAQGGIRDWTQTEYDEGNSGHTTAFGSANGHNLRNRVASVTRLVGDFSVWDGSSSSFAQAPVLKTTTYYSYDPHGNVRELVQEHGEGYVNGPGTFLMRKRMEYGYDLVSGNVNGMTYQDGEADMLAHRYYYDADNRLTTVYTSTDGVVWDNDAKYMYYRHGPLARMELGDKQLQGIDYAYTVHGWLKGANSNMLQPQYDMGKDGLAANDYLGTGSEGLHHHFADDAFGFTLGYYHNPGDGFYDYQMIGSGTAFEASLSSGGTLSALRAGTHNLYNGNIGHMVTSIPDPASLGDFATVGYAYRYDQLNRLKGMTAHTGLASNSWMAGSGTAAWQTGYSYDPNGNLLQLTRNDASGGSMDNISYTYNTSGGRLLNNKLVEVNDPVDGGVGDIYDLHEYDYDGIGNLVADESEGIEEIIWDAYGKIWQIKRTATSTKPELEFRYDGMGNRTMKIAKQQTGGVAHGQQDWAYTIYARDATGNTIAVYERGWESTLTFSAPDAAAVIGVPATGIGFGKDVVGIKVNGGYITDGPVLTGSNAGATATNIANAVNSYTGGEVEFTAETDGGMVYLFTEESYEQPFRYEILANDPAWANDAYFSFGRLDVLGVRPHSGSVTAVPLYETLTLAELHLYGSSRLGMKTPDISVDKKIVKGAYANNYGNSLYLTQLDSRAVTLDNPAAGPFFEHNAGKKQYELANHLGNVLVVIADKKVSHEGSTGVVGHYTASLLNVQDYFPGGWMMPGRKYSNSNFYRFKHQSQEGDDEIYGEGDAYFYTFRMSDSRLNRFWSVDPLAAEYPFYSTYAYSGNRLMDMVELEGAEPSGAGKEEGESQSVRSPSGISRDGMMTTYSTEEWVWHTGTCLGGTETMAGWYKKEDYDLVLKSVVYSKSFDVFDNYSKYYDQTLQPSDLGFSSGTKFTENGASVLQSYLWQTFSRTGGPNWLPPGGNIEYVPFVEALFLPSFLPFRVGSPVLRFGLETINPLGGLRGAGGFYHYTSEAGLKAITQSGKLLPSIGAKNARYGAGQYLTDLIPSEYTAGQVSRRLFGVPWNTKKVTHYLEIDVSGLELIHNGPNNFMIRATESLDLKGRIISSGKSTFKK